MSRFLYIVKRMFKKSEKIEYPKISINDEQYPSQLREIASPPAALYIRGHIPKNKPMIAVVGTRRSTPYGKRVTEHIVKGLVRANVVIVSGMAIGIDSEAHKAALGAGGETVAVVGSGIDESVIYPASNKGLAREIEKHGAVISEFDPYARSETFYFPQRNRVISGLSLGVVVIEAKEKSGALITCNFALDQNREVFAVPGSIFWETSIGPNNLIKQGAKAATCAEDILEEFGIPIPDEESGKPVAKNPMEQKIFDVLLDKRGQSAHIDTIVEKSGLTASQVSSALTLMELDERVKNLGGDYYVLG
ncbi:MAG: DNA-processing protein DprA [Candidatus Spechtbacterales bacterium]